MRFHKLGFLALQFAVLALGNGCSPATPTENLADCPTIGKEGNKENPAEFCFQNMLLDNGHFEKWKSNWAAFISDDNQLFRTFSPIMVSQLHHQCDSCSSMRIYLGQDDPGPDPTVPASNSMIMVNIDRHKCNVNWGTDSTVGCDTCVALCAKFDPDSGYTTEWVSEETVNRLVNNWQTAMSQNFEEGLLPVEGYSFSKYFIEVNPDSLIKNAKFWYGLRWVRKDCDENREFPFPDPNAADSMQAVVIIREVQTNPDGESIQVDFAKPCPNFCGGSILNFK